MARDRLELSKLDARISFLQRERDRVDGALAKRRETRDRTTHEFELISGQLRAVSSAQKTALRASAIAQKTALRASARFAREPRRSPRGAKATSALVSRELAAARGYAMRRASKPKRPGGAFRPVGVG